MRNFRTSICLGICVAIGLAVVLLTTPFVTRSQEPVAPKKITVVGTVKRIVAVGGETSGWAVELDHEITLEGKKLRSVEVSGAAEELEKWKDQRVRARGVLVHHTGMERGDYTVLEISSLKPAK